MVPVHLETGNVDAAKLATCYLRALEGLLTTITNPPKRAEAPQEAEFIDPAALLPKGPTDGTVA